MQLTSQTLELWTAAGTVGAVVLALIIALTQATVAITLSIRRRQTARRKSASLISAWLQHEYQPGPDGHYYRRSVTLHIANESDEPAYRLEAICGVETDKGIVRLGPLAAPRVIPAIPPKREFVYDVTMGMLSFGDLAHDALNGLVAEISFRDHEGRRWERGFAGDLRARKNKSPAVMVGADDELTLAQVGHPEDPYNPLALVFAFSNAASAREEITDNHFREALVEHAQGWKRLSDDELVAFREMLSNYNVAAHVWYPTPRIAYVRLLEEIPSPSKPQLAHMLTLVWRNERGWTLFGSGPFLPWDIPFDDGELAQDPLDGRPILPPEK